MDNIKFLMSLDRGKLEIKPTKKVRARNLSRIAGEDVFVTLTAISGDRHQSIAARAYGKDGNLDPDRMYDVQALLVSEAITDPNVKDPELLRHFQAATPKELVKLLFPGGELVKLSEEEASLSGFGVDAEDTFEVAKVKNS